MKARSAAIAGNPVLIGAATILVVLVAVFLAYNANKGLPFVPTYQLRAEVPSAANLVVGNDVQHRRLARRLRRRHLGASGRTTAPRSRSSTSRSSATSRRCRRTRR